LLAWYGSPEHLVRVGSRRRFLSPQKQCGNPASSAVCLPLTGRKMTRLMSYPALIIAGQGRGKTRGTGLPVMPALSPKAFHPGPILALTFAISPPADGAKLVPLW